MNSKPTDLTAARLLPCPFCGGRPTFKQATTEESKSLWSKFVCENIGCPAISGTDWHDTDDKAIAAWNTRPPLSDDTVRGALDALQDAILATKGTKADSDRRKALRTLTQSVRASLSRPIPSGGGVYICTQCDVEIPLSSPQVAGPVSEEDLAWLREQKTKYLPGGPVDMKARIDRLLAALFSPKASDSASPGASSPAVTEAVREKIVAAIKAEPVLDGFGWQERLADAIFAALSQESQPDDRHLCASEDPEDRCRKCDCWKLTREMCS